MERAIQGQKTINFNYHVHLQSENQGSYCTKIWPPGLHLYVHCFHLISVQTLPKLFCGIKKKRGKVEVLRIVHNISNLVSTEMQIEEREKDVQNMVS